MLTRQAARSAMPHVHVRDIDLHYRTYGSGAPALLIHGLGSSGADWAFQVPALSARRTLIVPDLRGSGASDKPPGPYRIADFAADLWALVDALGHATVDLVGFSLGGAVALEMALARPAAAQRLVLINSLPSYRVDDWRKWLEVHLHTALVRVLGLERTARLIAKRLFPHPHQAAMRARVGAVVGANPRAPYLATVRALAGWCALDRVGALACPTLMIAAEHDYTTLAEKRAVAALLGAELAVVRDSRHGTPFDAIQACNACLLAFLADEPLPDTLAVDTPETAPTEPPPGVL
jgi:pimeloyl-ACP methyl ester carboxylesterase